MRSKTPDAALTRQTASRGRHLGQAVYDTLRDQLFVGHYAAGERFSIDSLCEKFAVSRQPVMDAMRRLQSLGLVEVAPQSGCRVAAYSLRETEDFFRMFAAFEGEVAAVAAARRTEAQVNDLDAAWDDIEKLPAVRDREERARAYRSSNRGFHLVIHAMADSRIMAETSERMWDMSDFLIATVGGSSCLADSVHDRNVDHDGIRRAIRLGNADVSRAAMESHIVGTLALFET